MPMRKYTQEQIDSVVKQGRIYLNEGDYLHTAIKKIVSDLVPSSIEIYLRKDFECMKAYRLHHWHTRSENSLRYLSFVDQVRICNEELMIITDNKVTEKITIA